MRTYSHWGEVLSQTLFRRSTLVDRMICAWATDIKSKNQRYWKIHHQKKNFTTKFVFECPTPPHALYTENLKNEHCVYLHKRISHKLLLNPERNRTLWGHERKRKQIQFKYKFFNLKSYHKSLHYIICLKMHSVTLLQSKTIIMSLHTLYLKLIARLII